MLVYTSENQKVKDGGIVLQFLGGMERDVQKGDEGKLGVSC